MALISGRPISFQMDLYQPLFVTRPVVEPELFASLRPQVYGGNLEAERGAINGPAGGLPAPGMPAAKAAAAPMKDASNRAERQQALQVPRKMDDKNGIGFSKDVATAAVSAELGEYFQYIIKQPVSLPRQKSALLPIVNEEVKGTKVSIYNQNVHAKFPLLGLRFQNTTPLHLTQGPVTVFDDSTYAGDATIADLQPNDKRLISYAI